VSDGTHQQAIDRIPRDDGGAAATAPDSSVAGIQTQSTHDWFALSRVASKALLYQERADVLFEKSGAVFLSGKWGNNEQERPNAPIQHR
jgi:hypothetical protein